MISMIDYKKLKALREETSVSFSLCKKALEETENDLEKAKALLQKWGVEKAAKKADRETKEGGIFAYTHHNKRIATLVELQCETDFVSGNEEFRTLGNELAMQASFPNFTNVEEFMKLEYIRDPSKTTEQMIKDAILKFGENIKIARITRWEIGEE